MNMNMVLKITLVIFFINLGKHIRENRRAMINGRSRDTGSIRHKAQNEDKSNEKQNRGTKKKNCKTDLTKNWE